jgi:hypothetical protein
LSAAKAGEFVSSAETFLAAKQAKDKTSIKAFFILNFLL